MSEVEIGFVKHYFDKIGVAAITITEGTLSVGETIRIVGHTSNVTMTIDSMQIEHLVLPQVKKGDVAGMKVPQKVRPNDKVYKVTP